MIYLQRLLLISTLLFSLPAFALGEVDCQDTAVTTAESDPVDAADSVAPVEEKSAAAPEPTMPQKPTPPRPSMAPT